MYLINFGLFVEKKIRRTLKDACISAEITKFMGLDSDETAALCWIVSRTGERLLSLPWQVHTEIQL